MNVFMSFMEQKIMPTTQRLQDNDIYWQFEMGLFLHYR